MNYLGHLYLSLPDPSFRLGNLMADGLPAKEAALYPEPMQAGYRFHHWIDDYTDRHPAFRQSKNLLAESQGHYASVVADVLYDHFLARNWAEYSTESLESFSQTFYNQYIGFKTPLPRRFTHMMHYMIRYRWLESYAHREGLERALYGLSRRTSHQNRMNEAMIAIEIHYSKLEIDFRMMMRDIQQQAAVWLSEHVPTATGENLDL